MMDGTTPDNSIQQANVAPHDKICRRHIEIAGNLKMPYLVEQIDLGIGVAGIARMPQQQLNQSNERVERVKALHADARHHLARLRQRSIAQINTHLGTQPEEPCDEVVRLEDTL